MLKRHHLPVASIAWLVFAVLAFAGFDSPAQTFDATGLDRPTALGGMWRVHQGDDPSYAQPDFDDSKWTLADTRKSLNNYLSHQQPEIVWYRLRVKTGSSQKDLMLDESSLTEAFEIFVNGECILRSGQVAPFAPYTMGAHLVVAVPQKAVAAGSFSLAMRVHLSPPEWLEDTPGYYPTNLVLGQDTALRNRDLIRLLSDNALPWLASAVGFSVGLVALALYTSQRRQTEYLWIFLAGVIDAVGALWWASFRLSNVPLALEVREGFTHELYILATILIYFAFLRIRMSRWLVLYLTIVTPVALVLALLNRPTTAANNPFICTEFLLSMVSCGLVPAMLAVHLRRGNREAGILLIPALLSSVYSYLYYLDYALRRTGIFPTAVRTLNGLLVFWVGLLRINLGVLFHLLFGLSLAAILVWRSNRVSKAQTRLEGEMEAARQIQQVILPEPGGIFPGFHVESVYKPAQQVGGDFFQILPTVEDGLLLVFGDVAGKGLPAAMLVALLVGAIRTIARFTSDPAEILAELNLRLLGRSSSGFSTCLAAHIDRNGLVRLSNAGQIPPYLDGRELETPGALPLGIVPGQHYETRQLQLHPASRLVFYSDGVVEAQNKKGELLGFDRSQELSAFSASEIVKAASDFGQSDDITVVVIEREAVVEHDHIMTMEMA